MAKASFKRIRKSATTAAEQAALRKPAAPPALDELPDFPATEFDDLFRKLAKPLPHVKKPAASSQKFNLSLNNYTGASLADIEADLGPNVTTDELIRETYRRVRRIEIMLHKSTGNGGFMLGQASVSSRVDEIRSGNWHVYNRVSLMSSAVSHLWIWLRQRMWWLENALIYIRFRVSFIK